MNIVITHGTYDFLHKGYINLLQRAKERNHLVIASVM